MRKFLPFLLLGTLVFGVSTAWSYPTDVGVYRNAMVTGGNTAPQTKISTGNIILVDYLVVSTGNPSAFISFYDSQLSTFQYIVGYSSFPTNVQGQFDLGLELSSGAYINIGTSDKNVKARVRWYIKSR